MPRRQREHRTVVLESPVDVKLTLLSSFAVKRKIEDIVLTADSDKVAEILYYIELAEKMFGTKLVNLRRWITLVQTGKALKTKMEREKETEAVMGVSARDLAELLLRKSFEVRETA